MPEKNHSQLSQAPAGINYIIMQILSSPEITQRLQELGFSENAIIRTIVKNSAQLICQVNNTRVGIHHRIAKDIIISPMQ